MLHAGVVENVGWSQGSSHLRIAEQSWLVRNLVDVAAVLVIGTAGLLGSLVWAVLSLTKLAVRLLQGSKGIRAKQA